MASAQELYKWNPLQGQYSGYTNAIRAAQTMGTAIDNLGVRLGDVGKMMADRYDRIRKEDTEYNTNQALIQLAQIRDQQGLQEALQNGTLDASHWNELYGRNFDYNKLTSAVSNIYGDTLKRAENVDSLHEYTPESKQALINGYQAINNNDSAALFKALDTGQNLSNKTIGNLASGQIKQVNDRLEQGIRRDSVDSTIKNNEFNQKFKVFEAGQEILKAAEEERAKNEAILQGRVAFISTLGNLKYDEKGNLQPGELSKVNGRFKQAVDLGFPGSQEDFVNAVVSGSFSGNSFSPVPTTAQAKAALFGNTFGGNFPGIVNTTNNGVRGILGSPENQQTTQNGQQPQQGTKVGSGRGTTVTPPRNALTDDGNGDLGFGNLNAGEGVKIGGKDPDAVFNLNESPITRNIPAGTFYSHVAPFVDNKANGKSYDASTKGGIDYNGEFNSYNISQGDAQQLQNSHKKTVAKAVARLDASATAKIKSAIGLDNKGATRLIKMLTTSKLPEKLAQATNAGTRDQLIYQLQNDLNGKDLKQAEDILKQYLSPLLQHTWKDNTFFGVSADVERRALETARQTGFNADNLVNILSVIADDALKGDELKTAITGLSTMTPSNATYVRNIVSKLQANKDYFNSNETKAAIYMHLLRNKTFDGSIVNVLFGKSDLVQQRTEANQRDKNLGQQAIKKAASTAGDIQKIKRMIRKHN